MPSITTTPEKLLDFLDNIQYHQEQLVDFAVDTIYGNTFRLQDTHPQSSEDARKMLSGLKNQGVIRRNYQSVSGQTVEEYNEDVDNKNQLFADIQGTGNQINLPLQVVVERTMYLLDSYDKRRKTWFSFSPPSDPNYINPNNDGYHKVNYVKCYLGGFRKLSGGVVQHMRGRDLLINAFMNSINSVYDYSLDYIRDELL